jgi:hypothetical protein
MKPALLYFYDGTCLQMFHTPSGLAGSEEEFIRRCKINPGLIEIERIVRDEVGDNIYRGKFPSPIKCDMQKFEEKYGNIGGDRIHQILCLIYGDMPTEFLHGIDIEYPDENENNIFKYYLQKLFNKPIYQKIE